MPSAAAALFLSWRLFDMTKPVSLPLRLWYAAAGLLCGLFLAVRLHAFLVQAWSLALPLLPLTAAAALVLAAAGALLAGPVRAHLARFSFGGTRWPWVLYLLCMVFSLRYRGLVLDLAVQDGGTVLPSFLTTPVLLGGGVLLALFLLHLLSALWEGRNALLRWLRGLTRRDLLTVFGLFVVVEVAVFLYGTFSSTLYAWDSAVYWRSTYSLAEVFRDDGLSAALSRVYSSIFTSDYNDTIGLLCVPFALLFGPARRVYLMSIGTFCLFPVLLLIWAYARSLRRPGLWLGLAGICFLPSLFYTSVTGFVDIAGAGVCLLAMILALREKGKGRFSRFLLIGLLCALAVVLRRWYAFYALSFLIALLVDSAAFRRSPAPVLGYLCGFAFPLLFFLQTFVSQRLLANYAQMYAAYDLGLGMDVRMMTRYYGLFGLLVLLALGVWLCTRRKDRSKGVFLLLQPVLCFFIFVQIQSHNQQHLLLYIPAFACLALHGFHRLAEQGKLGYWAVAVAVLPTALSPALPRQQSTNIMDYSPWSPLPTFAYAPPCREGAMDVVELLRYMDQQFGAQGETVGLLSSSFTLNLSMLRYSEDSLSLPRVSDVDRSYLIDLAAVDQRDGFSAHLYDCDILAVADPIQLHLGEENQQVVWAPAYCMLNGLAIAPAYEELDSFTLEVDGITVHFYRKLREPTHEEKEALADLIHETHPDMYIPT